MKKVMTVVFFVFIITFSTQTTSFAEMSKHEELYHDMFISLLLPEIDKPVYKYYSKMITDYPGVYPYNVDVISLKRSDMHYLFFVTVEVTPVVGPHISLGKDRLTFRITPGHAKLLNYEHLETHKLPDNWKHILLSENE